MPQDGVHRLYHLRSFHVVLFITWNITQTWGYESVLRSLSLYFVQFPDHHVSLQNFFNCVTLFYHPICLPL